MKYLGIDYGTKKTGLAISDERGVLAFPKSVIQNDADMISFLLTLIKSEQIEMIVVGNSLDASGMRNSIMDDVDAFCEELQKLSGITVLMQDERYSSSAVNAFTWNKPVATKHRTEKIIKHTDDSAAAIMLQRYLDIHTKSVYTDDDSE